jgi:hypothetical protein
MTDFFHKTRCYPQGEKCFAHSASILILALLIPEPMKMAEQFAVAASAQSVNVVLVPLKQHCF